MSNALSRIAARVVLASSTLILPAACLAIPAVAQARNADHGWSRGQGRFRWRRSS